MKIAHQLRLESAALFAASMAVWPLTGLAWWWYAALFLLPDLALLGYLQGPRLGALLYNLAHSQTLGLALAIGGWWLGEPNWMAAGILLVGHSAFDRMAGYGLKYSSGFRETHLGRIGRDR